MAFLMIHKVSKPLSPSVFEFNQDFNEFNVVFQLRIDNLDILFVLFEQVSEI